mgnify:CR=1 FL=1
MAKVRLLLLMIYWQTGGILHIVIKLRNDSEYKVSEYLTFIDLVYVAKSSEYISSQLLLTKTLIKYE